MKKLLSLLSIGLLALVLAVPASAAAKPIDVHINGSKVTFAAGSPFLQNNSVLVPFRVVFEKLGLKVLWDAKTQTVTGTSADLVISLKVGSNRATVNGTVKKLTLAPISQSGTTYIPLRFIAEATGGTAVWNPANRSVQIDTAETKTADEAAITALIKLSVQYYNEEKAISFYSLMDSEASFTESVSDMNSTFEQYDLKNTIDTLEILNLKANEATVYTVERVVRTGGFYMPDEEIEYLYTVVRKNGVWKIADFETQNTTVLLTRDEALIAADVPQADSAAIKDNINKYYQYMNEENTDSIISTMTSYGDDYDATVKTGFDDFFASYNITYTLGVSNIYYYVNGEAAIYVESKEKEASETETYEQGKIFILSKTDSGSWTIDDTYSVSYELSK